MSIASRWRRWRRRRRAAKRSGLPLREFVYLDDTSVMSLLASRIGAVPTEYTDSESRQVKAGFRSKLGANMGFVNSDIGSSVEANQSAGTQVVRKSSVQSAFKELLEYEEERLVLQPPRGGASPPRVRSLRDLTDEARAADRHWVRSAAELNRGELLEVDVALDADEVFRVEAILGTLLQFVGQIPELAHVMDEQSRQSVMTAHKVLDQMLAGLVPLRGEVVNYRVVTIDGRDLIVHMELLEQVGHDVASRPLQVVAVAEAELFWRDIRRVLFSGARYTVLARLSRDGIQTEWTPVKLVDVLKDVVPDLASNFDGRSILTAIRQHHEEALAGTSDDVCLPALLRYGSLLGDRYNIAVDLEALATDLAEQLPHPTPFEGVIERREAFQAVTELVRARGDFPDEPEVLAELRETASLEPASSLVVLPAPDEHGRIADGTVASPLILDTEVVAIYW